MYESHFAGHIPSDGCIDITAASLILDREDFEGIQIAVTALAKDIASVTGRPAPRIIPAQTDEIDSPNAIIVGSITQSPTIKALIQQGKLDISNIKERWESFTTTIVDNPVKGVNKALLVVGSDKRGTIYGIYTLSEQIGVSPWYWWADVPPAKKDQIYAFDVSTCHGPPSVKYRGIFLNDEAPALSGWVHEKIGPHFNVDFYKRVFELLLRLKANYLWPAMWFGFPHPGNSFFTDDSTNQITAEKYGIVISTSHHEPMQRAMNEWFDKPYFEGEGTWSWIQNKQKITKYFQEGAQRSMGHESYLTMGMRGDGDNEMDVQDPVAVVQDILAVQRAAIKETYGKEDGVPQVMALYKEVQEYYEEGLNVPDDITLLFADDNFGTVRRLPSGGEVQRKGRSGIYYHLEYVGVPRSYKWLNSNSCAKVWQQLEYAFNRGADQIWVFNVGDLKPLEIPMSFVFTLAWNMDTLKMDQLPDFFQSFFQYHMGLDKVLAQGCSDLLLRYDGLLALRKHEHIEPETFSIINYGEADGILKRWQELLSCALKIEKAIPPSHLPSYFQLVLHPIKATYTYVALSINQAKNSLHAVQRRNTANSKAYEVLRLFEADFDLSDEYHALLDGKWNHIMRQPHYGYTDTWHAPARDMISGLKFVQNRQDSNPLLGCIGLAMDGHPGVRPGLANEEADRTHPSRRDHLRGVTMPPMEPFGPQTRSFEIYCLNSKPVSWEITSPEPWLEINPDSGIIRPEGDDQVVILSIHWAQVPFGLDEEVLLTLHSNMGDYELIHLPVKNRVPAASVADGFIEADGHVAINAASFQNASLDSYRVLPFIGRTPTGGICLKPDASQNHSEYLQYPFITFTETHSATLNIEFTLTLDTDAYSPICYDIQVDNSAITSHRLVSTPSRAGKLPDGWYESVMNNVWKRQHVIDLSIAGSHMLKIRLPNQNCVMEKIVIDLGGVRESYLGPPESVFYSQS